MMWKKRDVLDVTCKLPHFFIDGENSYRVECAKGVVDLNAISDQIGDCTYSESGNVQKLVFDWKKYIDVLKLIKPLNVVVYYHPDVSGFYKEKKQERVKAKISKFFDKERDTNLINGKLYEHQKDGVIFLQLHRNVILADDMGLGKTIESIEFLLRDKRDGKFVKALVIPPASLKKQWMDEIKKFAGDRLSVQIVDGDKRTRRIQWQSGADVLICNYESVLFDVGYGFLEGIVFSHVLLDEASNIKNMDAKRTVAIKKISANVPNRIALTGTPMENNLDELWSISDFVNPGIFGKKEDFKKRYGVIARNVNERDFTTDPDRFYGYVRKGELKKRRIAELRQVLKRVMIRRRKSDVLHDLPALTKMREPVQLDGSVQVAHDELMEQLLNLLTRYKMLRNREGSGDANAEMARIHHLILAKFAYMRQLCLMPELIIDGNFRNYKHERLLEILGEISSENKVVIFTEFRRVAKMLNETIPNSLIVHGDIDKMKRPAIIEEFQNSETKNVLISTSVLTYGVNLQFANYIVNYDLHFNPARMAQRTDRLHRIGQRRGVTVINLVATNSVEERIERILIRKFDMFCAVIEGKAVDPNFANVNLVEAIAQAMDDEE